MGAEPSCGMGWLCPPGLSPRGARGSLPSGGAGGAAMTSPRRPPIGCLADDAIPAHPAGMRRCHGNGMRAVPAGSVGSAGTPRPARAGIARAPSITAPKVCFDGIWDALTPGAGRERLPWSCHPQPAPPAASARLGGSLSRAQRPLGVKRAAFSSFGTT